jgi:hypothetical protein
MNALHANATPLNDRSRPDAGWQPAKVWRRGERVKE